MNIERDDEYAKTFVTARQRDSSELLFWFTRSDFYVTGLDFVFSRIALMC